MTNTEISKKFLGCKHPILGGAMSWISERNLVSAISNAGGFGVIAGGSMPPEILAEEIKATQAMTSAPFGVNLITMHPQLQELMQVCIDLKVSHVVLAGGLPSGKNIKFLKDAGIKVICFAPAMPLAKRLIKSGADALVVEGSEAGGHIGPVATSVLVQEILLPLKEELPIYVAGGIGTADMIKCYIDEGAAGCQLGTRFVCTNECIAHPDFKKAFIKASARDAMPTVQIDSKFPVIPVRALINKGTEQFMQLQRDVIEKCRNGAMEQQAGQLEIEHFWAGALKKAAIDGDIENGSLMAGQIVGMVKKEQSVQELMEELTSLL